MKVADGGASPSLPWEVSNCEPGFPGANFTCLHEYILHPGTRKIAAYSEGELIGEKPGKVRHGSILSPCLLCLSV